MAAATTPTETASFSATIFELGERLAGLLAEGSQSAIGGELPEPLRLRVADLAEGIRRKTARRTERDLRSLFELDDRLIDLMDRADEESAETGNVSEALLGEITEYLEAFRGKVDRIAGYVRWQESVAAVCGDESARLAAREKAAKGRVTRLKGMLLAFMRVRALKKLEGETSSINMQPNTNASLVVDDPLKIGEGFFERDLRITKTELQEILHQLIDGDLRRRLECTLGNDGWEINNSAVRAALSNNAGIEGARLVKGDHVRIR